MHTRILATAVLLALVAASPAGAPLAQPAAPAPDPRGPTFQERIDQCRGAAGAGPTSRCAAMEAGLRQMEAAARDAREAEWAEYARTHGNVYLGTCDLATGEWAEQKVDGLPPCNRSDYWLKAVPTFITAKARTAVRHGHEGEILRTLAPGRRALILEMYPHPGRDFVLPRRRLLSFWAIVKDSR